MSFLRKDPFGAAWVLISPERGLGPADFAGLDGAEGATDRALQKVHLMPWGGAAQARSLATLVELKPVDDPSATVSAGALQVSAELPSILEMETAAAPIRIVLPVHPRWQRCRRR